MGPSDLIFSFDIIVEELKSLVQCKQFVIKSEFADIFSIVLNSPDSPETIKKRRKQKKLSKNKNKGKNTKDSMNLRDALQKTQVGQSILYVGNIDILMLHMMQCPMEICLCQTSNPEERVGSTLIPWHPALIEYLMSLYQEPNPTPPHVSVVHSIFDEAASKRMAVVRLAINLRIIENVCWDHYKVLSRKHPHTFIMTETFVPRDNNRSTATFVTAGPGVIKTIYSGGKKKYKSFTNKSGAKRSTHITKVVEDRHETSPDRKYNNDDNMDKINRSILHFTRSDTDVAKVERVHLIHSKSCTAIKRIRPFDYVFADRNGPFGNKVYTVGYFTVDEPKAKTPSTSPQMSRSPGLSSKSSVKNSDSLDSNLTVTVKCQSVNCEHKKERPLLEAPDDRILLDLTNLTRTCCVTDSIQRKIEIIDTVDPCYCACECSFGFEKKTTYCHICKGYEKLADDLDGTPRYLMPDLCPIYHKIKVKTGSTSGSETKKENKKRVKSPDPEKKKGNDDRFKFNYGYKAPQIGHSRCVLPCTGTMTNVPKYMGWLWTADNVPGLMVSQGWKPGAVSKVILRKLKRAKLRSAAVVNNVPVKKSKKKCGDEPTLVISKKEGEYTVEMKVTDENEQNCRLYDPLIYKIASANHDEKIKRRQRKARRLIRNMIKEFNDPFHPENCQETCLRSYKEAVGIFDEISEIKSDTHLSADSCSEDGQESDESSLDVDWEIQFSPPNARGNS